MVLQFLANGLCSGALYAIVALGFELIYNTTGIFHFAHGAIYTLSAYFLYLFLITLKFPLLVSLLVSVFLTALTGFIVNISVYKPLEKKRTSSAGVMISSFGIYLFIVNLIALLAGNETKVLSPGIQKTFSFGNVILTEIQIISLIVFAVIFALFILFKKTQTGRLVYAYSDNPKLIEIVGFSSDKIKNTVFVIGSVLAGISSALSALDIGIDPNVGMSALFASMVAAVIGGVKVFEGAVLGGILLGIIQSIVVWKTSAKWMEAFTFIILIIFLLLRPHGILGKRVRIEEVR